MKILKAIIEITWLASLIMSVALSWVYWDRGSVEKFIYITMVLMALVLGYWAGYLR